MTHYSDGYRHGYLAVQLEQTGVSSGDMALDAVARQRADEAAGRITDEQMGDYWLGYYHGREAARREGERTGG